MNCTSLLYEQMLFGLNPSHKTTKAGHENDIKKQIKGNGGLNPANASFYI